MPLNSKVYATVVLGGIILICLACLIGRWRILAAQQEPPRLSPQRSSLMYSRPHGEREADPERKTGETDAAAVAGRNPDPAKPEDNPAQPAGTLDINLATAAELEALPGIGPVLAARIIAYREQAGAFHSVQELQEVEGIGDATLQEFLTLIRVAP